MAFTEVKLVEHLLDFVQTYSVQKDLKASEMFHALVLALYETRECIDLSCRLSVEDRPPIITS